MEVWKDIPGFEGIYQASSIGRVKSLDRYINHGNGTALRNGKILFNRVDRYGYVSSMLSKDAKQTWIKVHRMVAMAFIDNPDNKGHVNHINGDKQDNRVENLEWCTQLENAKHRVTELVGSSNERAIVQLDRKGKFVNEFHSIAEAARQTDSSKHHITSVAQHKLNYNTHNGFKWCYKDEYQTLIKE